MLVKVLNIKVVLPSQNEEYTYIETSEISVQDGRDKYIEVSQWSKFLAFPKSVIFPDTLSDLRTPIHQYMRISRKSQ